MKTNIVRSHSFTSLKAKAAKKLNNKRPKKRNFLYAFHMKSSMFFEQYYCSFSFLCLALNSVIYHLKYSIENVSSTICCFSKTSCHLINHTLDIKYVHLFLTSRL